MQKLNYSKHSQKTLGALLSTDYCDLTHEATESIESSWDSDVRVDLNQNVLGGVNVHLEETSSIERAIQQHHQTLVRYVWSGSRYVAAVL